MSVLGVITALTPFVAPVVVKMLNGLYEDYRKEDRANQGVAINNQGSLQQIPYSSGVMSVADLGFTGAIPPEPPILVSGTFLLEEFVAEMTDLLLDYDEQMILMFVVDEEFGDVYFFEFGFEGYAISLWPGSYYVYVLIVDPNLDELIGLGYPDFGYLDDPNPIALTGEGHLGMDFLILDPEDVV